MEFFKERFEQHEFHKSFIDVKTIIEELLTIENDDEIVSSLLRLVKVLSFGNTILEQIDPDIFPVKSLDNMNNSTFGVELGQ
ncbi:MAG: hypothetical protein ABIL58_00710 [Pseudomonadota bacterium]